MVIWWLGPLPLIINIISDKIRKWWICVWCSWLMAWFDKYSYICQMICSNTHHGVLTQCFSSFKPFCYLYCIVGCLDTHYALSLSMNKFFHISVSFLYALHLWRHYFHEDDIWVGSWMMAMTMLQDIHMFSFTQIDAELWLFFPFKLQQWPWEQWRGS